MNSLLQLTDVGFAYESRPVLGGITLAIAPGDFLVLTGPNGGGKTTLLRLMAGLLRPTTGHIAARKNLVVGYLPQIRSIDRNFPLTVRQTVLSGLQNRKPLLRNFTPQQHLQTDAALKETGLLPLADRPIAELSGGQWQRVLLARAVVSRPDLLLLDEPDTHLDTAGHELLHALLKNHRDTCATVLVSHDNHITDFVPRCRLLRVESGCLSELHPTL